jgi:hypothetical protein
MENGILSSPFSPEGLGTASRREPAFPDVHDPSPEVLGERYADFAPTDTTSHMVQLLGKYF